MPISYQDATGSFDGTFTVDRFTTQNGELAAVGTVTGDVTNFATGVTQTATATTTVGVLDVTGSCRILHLEAGTA